MVLIIDNYDSFTYNLVHIVAQITPEYQVIRNDAITLGEISTMKPTHILISPGPGRPKDAGVSEDVIRTFGPSIPTLGVCLGHQAIGEVFGGNVVYAPSLMHGKTSQIHHDGKGIYSHIPQDFTATRYHSLVVEKSSLPDCLEINSETTDGVIMGMRHKEYPIDGIQYHPESVLTLEGPKLIKNWYNRA